MTKCCVVALNICGPTLWNLLHITLLVPRTFWWITDFWKIWSPPNQHHHHVAFSYLRVKGGCFHFLLCAQIISFCVCLHAVYVLSAVPVHWVPSVVGLLACYFSYPKVISVTYFLFMSKSL